jgi:single-stranded-DNA-specific exonuclease
MTNQELLDQLLVKRGIVTQQDRELFLNPKYDSMYDPYLMHDMQKAVDRIFKAVENGERVCIYSDYDADGIPGAVILHDFFKKMNYENFCNYIPHRHSEGYGVHKEALEGFVKDNVKLVITVDVGITAVDEIVYGNSLGLEIIVTDHHEPLDILPSAFALVNPKLGNYPDRMLCGSGVIFKLVQAMVAAARRSPSTDAEACLNEASSAGEAKELLLAAAEGWEKWLLDMAGIATLSDMVPLINENRIIAYYGMKVLQKTPRPGLKALFEKSGINLNHLTETDIVFSVTPKLNAASRMAHPDDAFKLLATRDTKEGVVAAEHLAKLNDERKKIVATIMREVHKKIILRKTDHGLPNILVMGDPAWPAGILGLVASKITEEYQVTTFVWGSEGESIKGSCRGVGDISVVKLMQSVSHLLTQFGGHEEAGGFTTTRETVHFLEDEFNKMYQGTKHEISKQVTEISYDMELELSDVTMDHYRTLRQMAPFGTGNPKPVFAFKNIFVKSVNQFGKTKEHLEITLDGVRAISWYANPESFTEKIESGKTITLLAEFDHSVFRGKEELRLMIVDVLL